jgi:hypothetical protein
MSFLSWMQSRTSTRAPRGRRQHRPAAPRFRPQLETLEDRWLPSTLTVTSAADSGPGSLRADITAANPGDTIKFAPSLNGNTIQLTSGELDITKNLTIQGPGAGLLTISGNYNPLSLTGFRVFEVDGVTATIAGLTISNGYGARNGTGGGGGGGILNYGGHLTVSSCTLSNNAAAFGGAICNMHYGALTVSDCTLTGNQFTASEGQMGGGGIYNAYVCSASVTDSTLSGNHGPHNYGTSTGDGSYGDGGGIYNGGWMTLSGSTVTNNTPYKYGGGIYEDTYAHLSILNQSVVTNNHAVGDLYLAYGASPVTISSDSHVGLIIHG